MRKMSVGDAIHAATAIIHNLELVTRNDGGFKWIKQLIVVKPMP
jgi:toxin FitB